MRRGIAPGLALAAMVFAATPALAASAAAAQAPSIDWEAARAAFAAGAAVGSPPEGQAETVRCAAHWSQWAQAVRAGRVPDEGRTVSPSLFPPEVSLTALNWLIATAQPKGGESPVELEARIEAAMAGAEAPAAANIAAALSGDAAKMREVMGILGTCVNFAR